MGQPSIPSLNKSGESMYWNSMWDDKSRFEISLNESLFFKEVIPSFFKNFSEKRITSYMFKNNFYRNKKRLSERHSIQVTKKFNYSELTSKFDLKYNNMFFSNLWVLKFQSWVFLYFFVYHPSLKILKKPKKKIKRKTPNNNINNSIQNYINSLIYLKYVKKNSYNIHTKKYNF